MITGKLLPDYIFLGKRFWFGFRVGKQTTLSSGSSSAGEVSRIKSTADGQTVPTAERARDCSDACVSIAG